MKTIHKQVHRVMESPFIMMLFYLFMVLIKTRSILPWGRFWAEEATLWYPSVHDNSLLFALQYIPNRVSQYMLTNNMIVYLSTLVPFEYAPMVTTGLALLLQMIPVALIVFYRQQLGLQSLYIYGLILIMVGTYSSHEVWASSTNLYWHYPIAVAVILVLPEVTPRWQQYTLYGLLVLTGLSSFSIVFLLPVFLVRYFVLPRSRDIVIRTGLVLVTSLAQIVIFLMRPSTRAFEFDLVDYVFAFVTKHIYLPVFGFGTTRRIVEPIATGFENPAALEAIPLVALSIFIALHMFVAIFRSGDRRLALILLAVLAISAGHVMGAVVPTVRFIYPGGGSRYFYATTILFLLCAGSLAPRHLFMRLFFTLAVITSVLLGIQLGNSGPQWRDALAEANARQDPQVAIWPDGWFVTNFDLVGSE